MFAPKKVEGFNHWVTFAGFRDVCVGEVNQFLGRFQSVTKGTAAQFFDAAAVAGWEHLYFSVLNALKAFESGMNVAKSVAVECLLYASAQGQISVAFERVGLKSGSSQVAVVVVAEGKKKAEEGVARVAALMGGERDDGVLELSDQKVPGIMQLFGISDVELGTRSTRAGKKQALLDLVIERVALLAVQR
jgi:tRNA threonylcarbamoyladenosine modification (KEOPS) complex Cgi121 subunit